MRLIVIITFFILLSCSSTTNYSNNPGGSTETIGTVFIEDGTPVNGAKILFIPLNYNPQNSEFAIDSTISDSSGEFSFSSLEDGTYNIICQKENLKALKRGITIKDGEPTETIIDTIKECGSISGVVQLLSEHNNREIYVLAIGSTIFTQAIDSIGNFKIDNIPEGDYLLKFITTVNNYDIYDTTIEISSNINEIIEDTLSIPYIGIRTPENIEVSYNRELLKTAISWSSVEVEDLGGYQVTRREINDSIDEVIAYSINDTFFVDSCDGFNVLEGKSYIYKVSALDLDGRSGKLTKNKKVEYTSVFTLKDSLYIGDTCSAQLVGAVYIDGKIFAIASETSKVFEINNNSFQIINSYNLPANALPRDIVKMDDNTIMIATDIGIYNFDLEGNKLWAYNIDTYNISTYKSRYIYYSKVSNEFKTDIFSLDTYTGVLDTFLLNNFDEITDFQIIDDEIFILSNFYGNIKIESSRLDKYNLKTVYRKTGMFKYPTFEVTEQDIKIVNNDRITILDRDSMKVTSRFFISHKSCSITSIDNDNLIIMDREGKLKSYKK